MSALTSASEQATALANAAHYLNNWLVSRLTLTLDRLHYHEANTPGPRHPDDVEMLAELRHDLALTQKLTLTLPEPAADSLALPALPPATVLQAMRTAQAEWLSLFPAAMQEVLKPQYHAQPDTDSIS